MTTFWIVLALTVAAVLVARLVVALRHDGLGTTPPPSSHTDWSTDLPSHPFRTAG